MGEMSLEEVREILGDEARDLSNEDLLEELTHLNNIASLVIRNFRVLKDGVLNLQEVL